MKRWVKNTINILLIIIMTGVLVIMVTKVKRSNIQGPTGTHGFGLNAQDQSSLTDTSEEYPAMTIEGEIPALEGTGLTIKDYAAFGIAGFVLAAAVVRLLATKFHERTMKEAMESGSGTTFVHIGIIALTTGSIVVCASFAKRSLNGTGMLVGATNGVRYLGECIEADGEFSDGEYISTMADEIALIIAGDIKVSLDDINVEKKGDTEHEDFTDDYGINSAVLAKNGADVSIRNASVDTYSIGSPGVFAYGGKVAEGEGILDDTTIRIDDSLICTDADHAAGLTVSGGASMRAKFVHVVTTGNFSPAVRIGRGGGKMEIVGGNYSTGGVGSPLVYSTGDVTVKNATLDASASEGIIIEGDGKVSFDSVDLADHHTELSDKSKSHKNIFIYQSDSDEEKKSKGVFTAKNSNITTFNGDTFFCTNTDAEITLENTEVINFDSNDAMLRAERDIWGRLHDNGANVTLNLIRQKLTGNFIADEFSTITINVTDHSDFQATINPGFTARSMKLVLDKTSTLKLTGDCYLTELVNEVEDNTNIDFNGFNMFINGEMIDKNEIRLW